MSATPPLMSLRGIGVTYGGPRPVTPLRDVDCDIAAGERVAIVGPSGSGKSTLLNVIGLLEAPTTGTYSLAGEPTHSASERQRARLRRRHTGFVFQAFHLLPHRTVFENVAMGLVLHRASNGERRTRVLDLLEAVGLTDQARVECRYLSGGEKQRVAIARALVAGPSILLCDEPTGNLDSTSTDQVLGLLGWAHENGATVLVVTHEDHVASWAHRRISVLDGQLHES